MHITEATIYGVLSPKTSAAGVTYFTDILSANDTEALKNGNNDFTEYS